MNKVVDRKTLYITLLTMCLSFLSACSILDPPIPPTVPPESVTLEASTPEAPVGIDPSLQTGIVNLDRDPDIVTLMNAVSQQSLIGYVQTLSNFGTRNSFSATDDPTQGIGATRDWIFGEFERVGNGKLQVRFGDFPLSYEGFYAEQRNVIATLPGVSNYPGAIVIGAHYDSRVGDATDGFSPSPSANDNAAGVAMVIELARLMSSRTWNQTIIFVAFAAEEQNTTGSRYFVSEAIINDQRIDLAISNDTIGGRAGIPQTLRMFAPNIYLSTSGQTARYIEKLNQTYLPEFPFEIVDALDREGRYGDQREFIEKGIGAVRFTESREDPDLLNSPADTWEKIDYNYLSQVLRNNLVVVANWAGAPAPAPRPTITSLAEPGSYLVAWPPDLQAASYVASFRPINQKTFPEFRTIPGNEAGQYVFTGLDPTVKYAVSLAPVSISGRLGGFSPEVCISAAAQTGLPCQ